MVRYWYYKFPKFIDKSAMFIYKLYYEYIIKLMFTDTNYINTYNVLMQWEAATLLFYFDIKALIVFTRHLCIKIENQPCF